VFLGYFFDGASASATDKFKQISFSSLQCYFSNHTETLNTTTLIAFKILKYIYQMVFWRKCNSFWNLVFTHFFNVKLILKWFAVVAYQCCCCFEEEFNIPPGFVILPSMERIFYRDSNVHDIYVRFLFTKPTAVSIVSTNVCMYNLQQAESIKRFQNFMQVEKLFAAPPRKFRVCWFVRFVK